ncbi:MAG: hypothetical protein ACI89X_002884, partial [Planctomycetota bacterium]
ALKAATTPNSCFSISPDTLSERALAMRRIAIRAWLPQLMAGSKR